MSLGTAHDIRRFCGPILWLLSLIGGSTAETLLCGAISYQVVFEPSRPIFSSTFVAAAAATAAANSNDGSGATGSAVGGGTFAIPIARYTFRPLDQIIPGDVSLCHYNYSSSHFMRPPPAAESGDSRMVITTCAECARCTHDLATAHRLLSRAAVDAGLQSLLVVVRSPAGDVEENAPLRAIERIRLVENSPAKFVFMDEEPGHLSVCELMAGGIENDALKNFSKTSVLFVSISFIILMIISLAWLVFYYVQRFRYAHAKDRLQRRLFNAAKKALANTPTRPIKSGDKDLDTDCPVCIDPYKIGDIARILPCRHTFHKSCVDPWLLEHRTCPMCKSDILKAYGYHISASSTSSVGSAGGRRRAQFSGVGNAPALEANVSASGEFHYYPYHHRHNQRHGRPHRASVAASGGPGGSRRPHHVRSATIAGDATVSSRYGGIARTSSFDRGDSLSSDSNAFPFTIVNEIHDPFNLITSPRVVKIFDTKNLRHMNFEQPALGEIAVNPNVGTFSISTQSDEPSGSDSRGSAGYGRYATGADALNSPNGQSAMPSRQISSAEGRRAMRNAPSRLFRASTAAGRRRSQPPTLHVIHTNWRSLNHGQFPIDQSTCSTIESIENNEDLPESVEIGFEGVDESLRAEKEPPRRKSTDLA